LQLTVSQSSSWYWAPSDFSCW